MKRFCTIAFLLVLVLSIMAVPAYADGGSIQILAVPSTPTVDITNGDATFDVTLTVKAGSTPIGTFGVTLELPKGCTIVDYDIPVGGGAFGTETQKLSWYIAKKQSGDFNPLTITVKVSKENADVVDNGPIKMTVSYISDFDSNDVMANCQVVPGSIAITHTHHMVVDSENTYAATCGKPGQNAKKCDAGNNCTKQETEPVPATGKHTYEWKYTDDSGHWQECSVCGNKTDTVSHTFGNVVETKAPTCNVAGEGTQTCTTCQYKKTVTIDPDPSKHVPGEEWHSDENGHFHNCTVCGKKIESTVVAHTGKWETTEEATCQKEGKKEERCTECDYLMDSETLDKVPHEYIDKPNAPDDAATCLKPGKHYMICKWCEEPKTEESAALGHLFDENSVKDPAQHVDSTCSTQGHDVLLCSRCQGKEVGEDVNHERETKMVLLDLVDHHYVDDPDNKENKAPSYIADGLKVEKCDFEDHQGADTLYRKTVLKKLELDDEHLDVSVAVRGLNDNAGVQTAVEAKVEELIKAFADSGKPSVDMSENFAAAVRTALEKTDNSVVKVEVTVAMDDVDVLPDSFDDAPGALLDSKQLTITAKVGENAVDGDILSALPAPAAFSINKAYPNLIGLLNYGDEKGYSGLEFTKDGDVTTASALEVGYYALYTTSDLRWAEIFFDQTNVFNGSAVEPKVRIVVNGKELDSSYYTISYKNNTKVGTGEFSIELTEEGKAAGFTLEGPIVNDFEITAAPAKPTTKPAEKDKSQSDVPATGDETNVVLYAAVMVLCTAALALVLLRKKSSR